VELSVLERRTKEVEHHSCHIISRIQPIDLIYHSWCWPWLPGWGSILWKQVTMQSPHLRSGELWSASLRAEYRNEYFWNSLSQELYFFSHIYSSIYFCWCEHTENYFMLCYHLLLTYSLSHWSTVGHWEHFHQFMYPFHPHNCGITSS
jgi:hypothetical protein